MSCQIGGCVPDKNGTQTIPGTVDHHSAQNLLAYLAAHGYAGGPEQTANRLTITVTRDTLNDAAFTRP